MHTYIYVCNLITILIVRMLVIIPHLTSLCPDGYRKEANKKEPILNISRRLF